MEQDDKVSLDKVLAIDDGPRSFLTSLSLSDPTHQGESRGAVGCPTTAAASDFQRAANVRPTPLLQSLPLSDLRPTFPMACCSACRADDKTAAELNITAGSVLHLVLALRGGMSA